MNSFKRHLSSKWGTKRHDRVVDVKVRLIPWLLQSTDKTICNRLRLSNVATVGFKWSLTRSPHSFGSKCLELSDSVVSQINEQSKYNDTILTWKMWGMWRIYLGISRWIALSTALAWSKDNLLKDNSIKSNSILPNTSAMNKMVMTTFMIGCVNVNWPSNWKWRLLRSAMWP